MARKTLPFCTFLAALLVLLTAFHAEARSRGLDLPASRKLPVSGTGHRMIPSLRKKIGFILRGQVGEDGKRKIDAIFARSHHDVKDVPLHVFRGKDGSLLEVPEPLMSESKPVAAGMDGDMSAEFVAASGMASGGGRMVSLGPEDVDAKAVRMSGKHHDQQ